MAWVVIAERQKQIPINSTRIRNGRYPKKNDPFRIRFAHVSEETPFCSGSTLAGGIFQSVVTKAKNGRKLIYLIIKISKLSLFVF
jgi:hypothetical protein